LPTIILVAHHGNPMPVRDLVPCSLAAKLHSCLPYPTSSVPSYHRSCESHLSLGILSVQMYQGMQPVPVTVNGRAPDRGSIGTINISRLTRAHNLHTCNFCKHIASQGLHRPRSSTISFKSVYSSKSAFISTMKLINNSNSDLVATSDIVVNKETKSTRPYEAVSTAFDVADLKYQVNPEFGPDKESLWPFAKEEDGKYMCSGSMCEVVMTQMACAHLMQTIMMPMATSLDTSTRLTSITVCLSLSVPAQSF
jgi:hypothetical protein